MIKNKPAFVIVPQVGIGPVRLGMSRSDVEAALAEFAGALPTENPGEEQEPFFNGALVVSYNKRNRVNSIAVSGRSPYRTTFRGKDLFQTPADEVFKLFAAGEKGKYVYDHYGRTFPIQLITLDDADEQYDEPDDQGRPIWATISLGDVDYVAELLALKAASARSIAQHNKRCAAESARNAVHAEREAAAAAARAKAARSKKGRNRR